MSIVEQIAEVAKKLDELPSFIEEDPEEVAIRCYEHNIRVAKELNELAEQYGPLEVVNPEK